MEAQPQTEPRNVRVIRPTANIRLVDPGVIRLRRGDSVEFDYQGGGGAAFFFPKDGVFPQRVYELDSKGMLRLTVEPDAPLGEFAYAIYCRDIDDYALAGSPPKMIIEYP